VRFVMLFMAIAPAIIWLQYFWERGDFKVYFETLLIALAIGALTAFPAISAAMFFDWISFPDAGLHFQAFADAFLEAALPEEVSKFVGIYLCLYRARDEISSPYDIVVLAVAVSIGFAALENMFYIGDAANWTGTAFSRSLTAVPGHAFTGAIMGTFIAHARVKRRPWLFLTAALMVPILLHGLYDYFLFLEQIILTKNLTAQFELAEYAQLAFILTVCGEGALSIVASGQLLRSDHQFASSLTPDMTPRLLKWWQQAPQFRLWVWRVLSFVMIVGGLLIGIIMLTRVDGIATVLFNTNEPVASSKTIFAIGLCIFSIFHGITFLKHGREIQQKTAKKESFL